MGKIGLLVVRPDYPTVDISFSPLVKTIRQRCIGWDIRVLVVYTWIGAQKYITYQAGIDMIHIYCPLGRLEDHVHGCESLAEYLARNQSEISVSFEKETTLRAAMVKWGVAVTTGPLASIVIERWKRERRSHLRLVGS